MKPLLTLVVAMARGRVIGKDNAMPWHLPEDLKHFKAVTLGKPIIMGRKTWDSIGRPLPGRRNIVVTRNEAWRAEGAEAVHSLADALARVGEVDEACVIGGGELFAQALALADRLELTEIDIEVAGDAFFPAWDDGSWQESAREAHRRDDGLAWCYRTLTRRG
ncbi:dihydrofolate reductase [Crenobacter intestini]|uniref:Dihydrofolate reductase n=1 Tax=Crenobacter intestini TaxID=2563443 RepID=A0A4T0UJL5_9NEIS|nr:dihydrofolate reductase [Crenobacter intestini]TIC78742.1 dihydrofolate reductase [Crenobacter intestini]